jgi:hypothetical protein
MVPPLPSSRVAAATLLFVEELAKERGLVPLLQVAHSVLGFPIHLLDPGFCLLARVGGETLSDPRWLEYVETGAISDTRAAWLKTSGFMADLRNARRPIVDPGIGGAPDVIACDVVAGERLVGRLGVWATGPYGPEEIEIVLQLSRIVSVEIQRKDASAFGGQGDWLLDRILSQALSSDQGQSLVQRLGVRATGPYRVAVLGNADGLPCGDEYLLDRAMVAFGAGLGTVRDGQLVLLTSPGTPVPEVFLDQYDVKCGLSRPFDGIEDAREGFRQARAALTLGKGGRMVEYEDVFPLDVLSLCSVAVEARKLCYPPVARLAAYDRTYATDYLTTLGKWLCHSGNSSKTASALGIHYNTMKYRLQVIQQVMGVDLGAPGVRLRVEFSLWALGEGDLTLSVN